MRLPLTRTLFTVAICAALGVILGAFGAHGLKSALTTSGGAKTWEIAVFYHLIHAVAALGVGFAGRLGALPAGVVLKVVWLWLAGVGAFAGSLYILALGGPRFLGPVTPLGGLLFVAGWLWLAVGMGRAGGKTDPSS
jgi:uncharacterized membrane protein YgdD (TMEM256/DUF423 family)